MENESLYKVLSMKSVADQINDLTYSDYYYRLMLIALARFKWNGLEQYGIDEKWVEQYLYSEGRCIFFEDKDNGLGKIVTRCNFAGNLNN